MRTVVAESFVGFTRDLEGPTSFMYLDVLGWVTTGFGNKIDPIQDALTLPWRRDDGTLATRGEVIAAWSMVKALKGQRDAQGRLWTDRGGGIFAQFTTLRLDAGGVDRLVRATMANNDTELARRYGDAWEDFPACAQMACMSLAWACGSAYKFPHMDTALRAGDFMEASKEIEMTPEHNPGNNLKRRNEANAILMMNAARVRDYRLNPDLLDWTALIGISDAPTLPSLEAADSSPAPLPQLITSIIEPTSAASSPTIHPDPSMYFLDREPPDEPA